MGDLFLVFIRLSYIYQVRANSYIGNSLRKAFLNSRASNSSQTSTHVLEFTFSTLQNFVFSPPQPEYFRLLRNKDA